MSSTAQRDRVIALAKNNPGWALYLARNVMDPWYRAQGLSWIARYIDDDPRSIATEAAQAATQCDDQYKQSAVRAWEVAALAERNYLTESRKSLDEALALAKNITQASSRSEALYLLFQSAFTIGTDDAAKAYDILRTACPGDHWRCRRAVRNGAELMAGKHKPRPFFW